MAIMNRCVRAGMHPHYEANKLTRRDEHYKSETQTQSEKFRTHAWDHFLENLARVQVNAYEICLARCARNGPGIVISPSRVRTNVGERRA